MSSQKYQPPIYQIPLNPSQQLRVALDCLDNFKRWDFNALSKQFTSDFTQRVLPASLGSPPHTTNEYIEYLHNFRDSLKGAPLEMIIYEVNESKGKIWVHMLVKPVNIEGFFNFTFGTGEDENLIANFTEFVDSKMYADADSWDHSSSSDGQQETTVQAS